MIFTPKEIKKRAATVHAKNKAMALKANVAEMKASSVNSKGVDAPTQAKLDIAKAKAASLATTSRANQATQSSIPTAIQTIETSSSYSSSSNPSSSVIESTDNGGSFIPKKYLLLGGAGALLLFLVLSKQKKA